MSLASAASWVGYVGIAVVVWMHLLRWLLRRSLAARFDEAAEMAARPSSEWTEDDRDSGLGLPATQLRLAERVIAVRLPLLVGSVALVAVGVALA